MSDVIRLLPDSVANQIAAGEVIQRPASVVKELVENAVDAGAGNIHVIVKDAGKTCIQVTDDGKGMSETDARMSFERHATSKIRDAADLFSLHTMGFRGEALASVAAVAQVELRTRRESDELGTFISIAGSKVLAQEPVSCAKGSSFSVNNLFFNVPARRKFLKSNQTELSNILAEFERMALVRPDVAFTLCHNGSELFNLPVASPRQRIMDVFGKKINQQLLGLEVGTSLVKITGYVGKPETSRRKGSRQYFFVNGRYMRHPYFHRAVMGAYENLIPAGEQISYFIYFEMAPSGIDVNIHPAKTEIKFENEQAVWQILSAAVKESLGRFNAVPGIDFDTEGMPDIPVFTGMNKYPAMPSAGYDVSYNPFASGKDDGASDGAFAAEPGRKGEYRDSHRRAPVPSEWERMYLPSGACPGEASASGDSLHGSVERADVYFQFKGRYILTSVKSGLMIIEQTRAHLRVLYDRYLSQLQNHRGVSQRVLFPEIVRFPASEAVMLDSICDDLLAIGFDLSNLGGGSYSVNGVPAGMEGLDPAELLRSLVGNSMAGGNELKEDIHHRLALTMAKSVAIVPGQVLGNDEMGSLVDGLFLCQIPNYTPEGKPILSVISGSDIDKLF